MKRYTFTLFTIMLFCVVSATAQSQFIYYYPLNNNANNNPFNANVNSFLNTTDATNGTPVGCYNADISAQNNNGTWVVSSGNRSPKWTNSGTTFSMLLETDWANASNASRINLTITFKQGVNPVNVSGVTFNIYDINSAICGTTTGIFIDSVSVRGRNTASVYQNMTLSSVNSCITATGSGTSTTTFRGGASCGANALSATVTFSAPISTLEITYASGRGYPANVTLPCASPFPLTSSQDTRVQHIIISPINLGGCPPLPLHDFSLKALSDNNKTVLQWNTNYFDTESDYIIEKSINGVDFYKITDITSYTGTYYDHDIFGQSTLYYRIAKTSKDGQVFYSSIEQITLKNEPFFTVFPNPAQNIIHIQTNSTYYMNTPIYIFDYTGKKVTEIMLSSTTTEIDISILSQGLYFIRSTDGQVRSFVKK